MGLFKSLHAKSPPVIVIFHDFAGCSQVCTYAHNLSIWPSFFCIFRPVVNVR